MNTNKMIGGLIILLAIAGSVVGQETKLQSYPITKHINGGDFKELFVAVPACKEAADIAASHESDETVNQISMLDFMKASPVYQECKEKYGTFLTNTKKELTETATKMKEAKKNGQKDNAQLLGTIILLVDARQRIVESQMMLFIESISHDVAEQFSNTCKN